MSAQHPGQFIYGEITTKSGEQFEGFIRWGKEELYWHDMFNSDKSSSNPRRLRNLEESKSKWSEFSWGLASIWEDKYYSSHSFSCLFGDIKSLHLNSSQKVDLELRNGAFIKLGGGSNDIGTTLRLHDYELGSIKFDWSKIKKIEFMQAPEAAVPPYGKVLYGELTTKRRDIYEGFIKWDLDERTGEDILDGSSKLGTQKIAFKNIAQITNRGNGVNLVLNSGRELYMSDSNDVDQGNRGIRIYIEGVGNITVEWEEFKMLEMMEAPHGPFYNDFSAPIGISAEVHTFDNDPIQGLILFDVDEMWEMEMLDGKENNLEFNIPFRNITKVIPKNSSYSMVYLCNGQEFLLGDTQDVSNRNDGILLINEDEKVDILIKWNQIDQIIFK